jgi:dTDP-4-amino-4,6-dideoxygalactose transaminase
VTKVPLIDLAREARALGTEIREAVEEVLRSGQFVLGPRLEALEREVARYLGVRHAVGLNSGTDALILALEALGVGPGDEVLTTPFTFVGTAEAIRRVGARPVFVDIDPDTFNLDPRLVERALGPRTRAILPVHLFGHPAEMDPLLEIARARGLRVLEDACQAFGASYLGRKAGSLGDAATFSFYPTKSLGAYGDGGMITTDYDAVAEAARELRNHGSLDKYRTSRVGYNSRLDEIQAAILRVKLPHVDRWNETRREMARRYSEALSSVRGVRAPVEAPYAHHIYHQYTVRLGSGVREAVREKLLAAGIATSVYYPVPLHRLAPYRMSSTPLPHAERACEEVLNLPLGPTLREDTPERVAAELARIVG